ADALVAAAAGPAREDNNAMANEVGLPLMRWRVAFAAGDAAPACRLLYPLRTMAHRFGGSHAPRDLIDQTLLAAAADAGEIPLGRALLNERRLAKPVTPLTDHWAARIGQRLAH
ncbi:MAG: tetratricopeptide repeat protein, partial [Rhizobiales bacterium]|nr:tetratricopeptide repeat protein [Rhizobacter sp.]